MYNMINVYNNNNNNLKTITPIDIKLIVICSYCYVPIICIFVYNINYICVYRLTALCKYI